MTSNARGTHTSPGIYSKEIDLAYAAKSIGITTLGVAGETLKGPAFEPIRIENWKEFVEYFGGTSAEKFKDSQYPKYELPYIAKSYLTQSNQLEVCRVLGLSGYNAGPAFLITAEDSASTKYVVAVLRCRGEYDKDGIADECNGGSSEKVAFRIPDVTVGTYSNTEKSYVCGQEQTGTTNSVDLSITPDRIGKFNLKLTRNGVDTNLHVSLDPKDKDFIANVLGTNPSDGDYDLYVEEVYPTALAQMINDKKVNKITSGAVTPISVVTSDKIKKDVDDLVKSGTTLTKEMVGGRYLVTKANDGAETSSVGEVLTVNEEETEVESEDGKKAKTYKYVKLEPQETIADNEYVFVTSMKKYYKVKSGAVVEAETNMDDYKESFRCASTPWIVSDLRGTDVKKLFRFHTISDGDNANKQVKISIENIRPDEGLFDVVVRDYYDTDSIPVVLEKFQKCNMVKGTNNFIGLRIGTFDGEFALKSKYIMVEVVSNDMTESCVPAGFMGYPMRKYDGLENVSVGYNDDVYTEMKPKKQYFGLSDLEGIDGTLFEYKGADVYREPINVANVSNGFHLDSYVDSATTVDGMSGFKFTTVKPSATMNRFKESKAPVIASESAMDGTIYEDAKLRKFTVIPFGGFDGWDIYRNSRTNTDEYKMSNYKGSYAYSRRNTNCFTSIVNPQGIGLTEPGITSDYYAYLAAYKQFANPESVDINVFATPGIDYVNNRALSVETLDMIEEERGDAVYIMTTPDKPFGASDSVEDMYYPDDAVANLEDSDIDSSYASTYYPWVNYYDNDNNVYINLPATKDIVRSIAYTDNTSQPWFAPAGTTRGSVECERAHFITKLADEDTLYEGMINPIKTFARDGVVIWGQKTMYSADTPLNRLNVRRLMLRVKKLISMACRRLIFEQNDGTVKAQFETLVKPILNNIKKNRGIYDYKLVIDDSAEARDRLELPAVIYIKPTKALEYIDLSFVIMPESAKFED